MTTTLTAEPDTTDEPATALDPAQTYPYYREVDPRELRRTGNSREVGDILTTRPDLVATMAAHGFDPIASVINVAPDPDTGVLGVLVGFHRAAAAIAVIEHPDPALRNPDLRVGVLVHAPGTTRQQVLLAQGVENLQRVGFSLAEEASYYHQLALEGLDDAAIAREIGQPVERVRAGRAVAASARTHAAAQQVPEGDLVTMAKLAEFADDEETHQSLVAIVANRPGQLDYYIRDARNQRERDVLLSAECDRLTEKGYLLIEDEEEPPEGALRLKDLVDSPDDSLIDPERHAGCPGRAVSVYVDSDLKVDIVHFCVDFAEHGHRTLAEANIDNVEQQLREQGVRLVDPDTEGVYGLRRLFADDNAEHTLTPAEHNSNAVVHWVCTDYAEHGHVVWAAAVAPRTVRDAAYLAAERKRAKVNNAAWKVAKATRREWLAQFFSGWRRRKANQLPAKLQHWLGLGQVLASDYLNEAAPKHRYACTLLGLDQPTGYQRSEHPIAVLLRRKNTSEPQAIMARLAMVLGACEEHWDLQYTNNADASWRGSSEDARFYFELLAALGYELSPAEVLINHPEADVERWPHLKADAAKAA